MAIYRNIQMSFWTDSKVVDNFTPEDKYFYLYLLTNPHTNLAGCYEISLKQISDEIGYTKETVEKLIKRMSEVHNVIRYSKETKEVLILHWFEYNWTSSDKFRVPLSIEINSIKEESFRQYLSALYDGEDTVLIPYLYGSDTTVSVYINNNINNINKKEKEINKEKEKQEKKNSHSKEVDELFELLWKAYPRKEGKNQVSKKAKESIYKLGYEKVLASVNKYKELVKDKDRQYILMGSTFFNGRYEDYLPSENERVVKHTPSQQVVEEELTEEERIKQLEAEGVKWIT